MCNSLLHNCFFWPSISEGTHILEVTGAEPLHVRELGAEVESPRLLQPLATEESFEVPRAVNDAKNLHTVEQWEVQYEEFLEALHPEHPQRLEGRMFEARMLPDVGLGGEESKRVVRRHQESVAEV